MKSYFNKSVCIITTLLLTSVYTAVAVGEDSKPSLRQEVVARMREMATLPWTPSEDLLYWVNEYGVIFKKGVDYEGIPYTQKHRETPPELFRENLDKDGRYIGPAEYLGTDCSSSVSIAWRKADPDLPYLSTYFMFPGMGKIVAVGSYSVTSTQSTSKIIADNGEEKIRASFDQMKPGDVILWREDREGHVRMVSKIDPANKMVYIIEQTGLNKQKQFKGKKGTWRIDYGFSYDELIENGYIPITHKALVNEEY